MIYEMLAEGEQNARSAKDLAKLRHCEMRHISLMVEAERRNGKPICASCDSKTPGYYIPESREDMQSYCSRLLHRMEEIAKTRNACLRSMERLQ